MNPTQQDNNYWDCAEHPNVPVGTLYCIGRNYAAHAQEMGAKVPSNPIVFIKPPAAYAASGSTITIPSFTNNVHHEVELVVVIGDVMNNTPSILGVGVGIDFTARDIQAIAKQQGEPWAVSKGWKGAAPISAVVPINSTLLNTLEFSLAVNGTIMQHGFTRNMERSVEQLLHYVHAVFGLRKGDAIFTGTPEGVAQVHPGDKLVASLQHLVTLEVEMA